MYDLSKAFIKSLEASVESTVIDYAELGVDALAKENIFVGIPFISTCVSVYKIGKSIRECHHLKQLLIFLTGVGYGRDEEERLRYILKFNEMDPKQRNKELEYVVVIMAQYISNEKPEWLAKIYRAYLDRKIDWAQFTSYAEVINQFLPQDMEVLLAGEQKDVKIYEASDSLLRLTSVGMFLPVGKNVKVDLYPGSISVPAPEIHDYYLTSYGKDLRSILLSY